MEGEHSGLEAGTGKPPEWPAPSLAYKLPSSPGPAVRRACPHGGSSAKWQVGESPAVAPAGGAERRGQVPQVRGPGGHLGRYPGTSRGGPDQGARLQPDIHAPRGGAVAQRSAGTHRAAGPGSHARNRITCRDKADALRQRQSLQTPHLTSTASATRTEVTMVGGGTRTRAVSVWPSAETL